MTVEFTPKKEDCFSFGNGNGVFFDLLRIPDFSNVLNDPSFTNAPIMASHEQPIALAKVLKQWSPRNEWG